MLELSSDFIDAAVAQERYYRHNAPALVRWMVNNAACPACGGPARSTRRDPRSGAATSVATIRMVCSMCGEGWAEMLADPCAWRTTISDGWIRLCKPRHTPAPSTWQPPVVQAAPEDPDEWIVPLQCVAWMEVRHLWLATLCRIVYASWDAEPPARPPEIIVTKET